MRFTYSTNDQSLNDLDSLPFLPIRLSTRAGQIDVRGLVDSGSTINVLPYQYGLKLGLSWNDQDACIRLAGNLGNKMGTPVIAKAVVAHFHPVRLAFAWVQSTDIPLILGQTNFFMEFDVFFFRSKLVFDIMPKSS